MPKRAYDLAAFRADWEGGVSTEEIARRYGLKPATCRTLASNHGYARPADYLSKVRSAARLSAQSKDAAQ